MTERQGRNSETRVKERGSYSYLHSGLPRTYAPEMHNSPLCVWCSLKRERKREKEES